MSVSVTMPRLGESVTEGTVTRWLKKEGDQVEADEPLLEVSTDKVDTEIPAPASGVLSSIRVGEDETVEVGVELAVIEDSSSGGGSAGAPAQEAPQQEQPAPQQAPEEAAQQEVEDRQASAPQEEEPQEEEPQQPAAQQEAPQQEAPQQAPQQQAPQAPAAQQQPPPGQPSDDSGAYVTPLVRKLAAEHGVDLAGLRGTGVGGRIRKQDVLEAARSRQADQQPRELQEQQPVASSDGRPPQATSPVSSAPGPASSAAVETPPAPRVEPSPLRGRTEKMSRLRSVIARRMVESLQVSAQLTTVAEVDVTRVARLRQRAKADFERREGVKLSFLPFFAVAAVEALKQHPGVNASIDTE